MKDADNEHFQTGTDTSNDSDRWCDEAVVALCAGSPFIGMLPIPRARLSSIEKAITKLTRGGKR